MSDSREAILATVRTSLKTALLPGLPPGGVWPEAPAPSADVDVIALADAFARELLAVGGQVHRPRTVPEAISSTLGLLEAASGREILAWDDVHLPIPGIGEAVRQAGFAVLDPVVPADPEARRARLLELGRASAGLTGAVAGLAEAGSVVLTSGPGRPRLAALLPPIHVALLPAASLYPSFGAFLAARPAAAREGSHLLLVTGPSRTADIEMTLTRGVHGPRVVHVVLVP